MKDCFTRRLWNAEHRLGVLLMLGTTHRGGARCSNALLRFHGVFDTDLGLENQFRK
jgi:hypothetical protein